MQSTEESNQGKNGDYWRFGAMIATAMAVMFALTG